MTTRSLQRARLGPAGICFSIPGGLHRALADGCFLLAHPAAIDLEPGRLLCSKFYQARGSDPLCADYQGMRDVDGIYFDREHFQTEHLLLDGPARSRCFPPELVEMCDQMSEIGLIVLRSVLQALSVPESLWGLVTGGAVDGHGTHWFAASHYRPERALPGCAAHKDTGFVTVLYVEDEGLEFLTDEGWEPLELAQGHFVVNFGASLELLTERLEQPVSAILHRVRRCEPSEGADRFSFAAFANPPATGMLYQVLPDARVTPLQPVESFLREFNEKTWADDHNDFGIASPQGHESGACEART